MKRFFLLLVVVLLVAATMYAASDNRKHRGVEQIGVTTDSLGDSTIATGSFGAFTTDGYNTLQSEIIIGNAKPAYAGLGVSDSGIIFLYTHTEHGANVLIDSTSKGSLPCTLSTIVHSNVGDTLIREYLEIEFAIHDTLGDSLIAVNYPITYSIKLK